MRKPPVAPKGEAQNGSVHVDAGGRGSPGLLAIAFSGVPRWCGFKKIVLVVFNKNLVLKNDLSYVTGLDCLA